MGPEVVCVLPDGGAAEAASVLEPGCAAGAVPGLPLGNSGLGGGSSIAPLGGGDVSSAEDGTVLVSSLGGAFCWAVAVFFSAWLSIFPPAVSQAAGDGAVSALTSAGFGSTAFPCLLTVCLRVDDVVMDAAY